MKTVQIEGGNGKLLKIHEGLVDSPPIPWYSYGTKQERRMLK